MRAPLVHFGNGGMRVPCSVAPGRISLAIGLARARQADGTNNPRPCKFCRDVAYCILWSLCDQNRCACCAEQLCGSMHVPCTVA
jgi:hypothetical protein